MRNTKSFCLHPCATSHRTPKTKFCRLKPVNELHLSSFLFPRGLRSSLSFVDLSLLYLSFLPEITERSATIDKCRLAEHNETERNGWCQNNDVFVFASKRVHSALNWRFAVSRSSTFWRRYIIKVQPTNKHTTMSSSVPYFFCWARQPGVFRFIDNWRVGLGYNDGIMLTGWFKKAGLYENRDNYAHAPSHACLNRIRSDECTV